VMIEFDMEFTSSPTKEQALHMGEKVQNCAIFLQVCCTQVRPVHCRHVCFEVPQYLLGKF
jgi:hypothetical protein